MIKSYLNGYPIVMVKGQWIYWDTKEPTMFNNRPCGYCGKERTKEDHDVCLGTLPGIRNACCGHVITEDAYVQFQDMYSMHGIKAKTIIEGLIR